MTSLWLGSLIRLRRLQLKALPDGDPDKPAHYPLKISLNSLYGKFAQQRGYRTDENGTVIRVPTYYQPEYSGFITSHCRAKVFRAAMTATAHRMRISD